MEALDTEKHNPTAIQEAELQVGGMTCASCSAAVMRTLKGVPGVVDASVDLIAGKATVHYQDGSIGADALAQLITGRGYPSAVISSTTTTSTLADSTNSNSTHSPEPYTTWKVMTVLALSVPMAIHGMWHGQTVIPDALAWGIATAVVILYSTMLGLGFKRLLKGNPGMESLVMLSTTTAYVASTYTLFHAWYSNTHVRHLYLEDMVMVLAFVGLGKWLEQGAKGKTQEALTALIKSQPEYCLLEVNGHWAKTRVEAVPLGSKVQVPAWQPVALDGEVVEGSSHVQAQALTGEPMPVAVQKGARILAGSTNQEGVLVIRTTASAQETVLQKLVRGVEKARATRLKSQDLTDQIAYYFVPIVLALAVIGAAYWTWAAGTAVGLQTLITVLVVACPCSLGLAVPIVVVRAMGIAAKRGILLRNVNALETLNQAKHWLFDKTGTLTSGTPTLTQHWYKSDELVQQYAPALQQLATASYHPLAKALVKFLNQYGLADTTSISTPVSLPGMGVQCMADSKALYLGNPNWIKEQGTLVGPALSRFEKECLATGLSQVWFMVDGTVLAAFGFSDALKPTAGILIPHLMQAGTEIHLLSGDGIGAVTTVADELGIKNVKAQMLPTAKQAYVTELQEQGELSVFVGDGINDAAAMSTASTSVAMGMGADLAKQSAEIVLLNANLESLITLRKFSRQVMGLIRQNLVWAFGYNVVMIPLALGLFSSFGITLQPMWAGMAMAASSVLVVLNGLRTRWPE